MEWSPCKNVDHLTLLISTFMNMLNNCVLHISPYAPWGLCWSTLTITIIMICDVHSDERIWEVGASLEPPQLQLFCLTWSYSHEFWKNYCARKWCPAAGIIDTNLMVNCRSSRFVFVDDQWIPHTIPLLGMAYLIKPHFIPNGFNFLVRSTAPA